MLVIIVYQDGSTAPLPAGAAHLHAGDLIAIGGLEHRVVWTRLTVAGGELLELFTVPAGVPEISSVADASAVGVATVGDRGAILAAAGYMDAEVIREGAGFYLVYQTIPERYELEAETQDQALAEAAEFLGGVSADLIRYRDH